MGYGPTGLNGSGLSVGASFTPVSGDKVDLYNISVVGYEGEAYAPVQVQTLTGSGGTDRTFLWYEYGEGEDKVRGWYEDTEEGYVPLQENDVTLNKGEGLWSVSDADTFKLQSSGAVETVEDVVTPLNGSGLTIANPTPVNADLYFCYVGGYQGEAYAPVQVQTLTGSGGTARTFLWYEYGDGEDKVCGWYEDTEEGYVALVEDDVVLTPGEGLWSVSDSSEYTFVWPKVDVK